MIKYCMLHVMYILLMHRPLNRILIFNKTAQSCHLFDRDTLDAFDLPRCPLAGGSGVPELDEVEHVWLGVGDRAKNFGFTSGCALVLRWQTQKRGRSLSVWGWLCGSGSTSDM